MEVERPPPLECACQNGGVCVVPVGSFDTPTGECRDEYSGPECKSCVARRRVPITTKVYPAAIILPVLLVLLLAGVAVGYTYVRRRGGVKTVAAGLPGSAAVSFRPGTNVEFGANGASGDAIESAIDLAGIDGKARNFSNPMYDTMSGLESSAEQAASAAVYEVPSDLKPDAAVLAPSSVVHSSATPRSKETKPAAYDSGKDTQQLVEDDEYDC